MSITWRVTRMQSAYEQLAFLRRRAGVYLNRARRSVWLHARDQETFEAAQPLIGWLRATVPTDRLLFTSARADTCTWLRQRYPNDNVLPPPWGAPPLVSRFFRQLQPLIIICVGEQDPLGRRVVGAARARGVPVVVIEASDASGTVDETDAHPPSRHAIATLAPLIAAIPPSPDGMPDRNRLAGSKVLWVQAINRFIARRRGQTLILDNEHAAACAVSWPPSPPRPPRSYARS
jgi:hypothetical protein